MKDWIELNLKEVRLIYFYSGWDHCLYQIDSELTKRERQLRWSEGKDKEGLRETIKLLKSHRKIIEGVVKRVNELTNID